MEKLRIKVNCPKWQNFLKPLLSLIPHRCLTQEHYPDKNREFEAFNKCPFDKLSVVILGQDPYFTPNTANGLAFSCTNRVPKSLSVIFNAIQATTDLPVNRNPDLSRWASQGVLLLNTALTVKPGLPGSHALAWEDFTRELIKKLSGEFPNLVWMLWGKHAEYYRKYISSGTVIIDCHPAARTKKFTGFFNKVNHIVWT